MRIISGFLKGRKINYLKNSKTRPLKDSVKENIFNIICHSKSVDIKINNAIVLDLYSGIGSFGIECISRGAKEVTFIEKDLRPINILKDNLNFLSIKNKTKLFHGEINNELNKKFDDKFDIFFLDPPFSDNNFIDNLKKIKQKNLFKRDHIIIIHREKKKSDNISDLIKITNVKEYGRSKIIFGNFN